MKVRLVAYTPNPDAVCNLAAGTCVSEDIPVLEMSTNRFHALKGALKSGHESVTEHASFTFAISGVSRALTHQLVRHRMASFSQQSQRYVNMENFEYVVPESVLNAKSVYKVPNAKNDGTGRWVTEIGTEPSGFPYITAWNMSDAYDDFMRYVHDLYNQMIKCGVPEEDARYILPNACTTNIVVTMNARELRHFFRLRCCTRAQWEIRELANKMVELCKEVAPVLFDGAGASCVATGRCPEGTKSCGRVKA